MNPIRTKPTRRRKPAFTLIELLVVIGIITVLAALLFPAGMAVKRKALMKRVEGELAQLQTAITRYQLDKGFYPPDNADVSTVTETNLYHKVDTPASINSLYYELMGVKVVFAEGDPTKVVYYETLGSAEQVTPAELPAFGVSGIMNADRGGRNNSEAKNYLSDIKPAQHSGYDPTNKKFDINGKLQVMSVDVEGPGGLPSRFCYVSSSPKHNPKRFDLWVDVFVGSKTNRFSNWSVEPETISY